MKISIGTWHAYHVGYQEEYYTALEEIQDYALYNVFGQQPGFCKKGENLMKVGNYIFHPNTPSLKECFYECRNLTSISNYTVADMPNLTDISDSFSLHHPEGGITGVFPETFLKDCPLLENAHSAFRYIPITSFGKQLQNKRHLKDVGWLFQGSDLKEITVDIFEGCDALERADLVFSSTKLTRCDYALFKNKPELTNISSAFSGCPLTYLVGDIVANCPKLIHARDFLSGTRSLKIELEGIFENCPEVMYMSRCFYSSGCIPGITAFQNKPKLINVSEALNCNSGISTIYADMFRGSPNIENFKEFASNNNSSVNLKTVEEGTFANLTKIKNMDYIFNIPNTKWSYMDSMLFKNKPYLEQLSQPLVWEGLNAWEDMFEGSPNIKSMINFFAGINEGFIIPPNTFDPIKNTLVSFRYGFSDYKSQNFDIDLSFLKPLTALNEIAYLFHGCFSLTETINLQDYIDASLAIDATNMYSSCGKLKTITEKAFPLGTVSVQRAFTDSRINNQENGSIHVNAFPKGIVNFTQCFCNTRYKINTPVNEDGLELYERAGKPGYPENIIGTQCFYKSSFANLANAPSNWK